ncbi:uncharacterized protein LOC133785440 [Humulus lupulus]|uniref:uncharacterized protein LOC133785440 n=1 Tax=Humulus lupulus TaxID=3486 RepID=UPI002B413701|nr:uncharacterized protein LOC133785440 [Humulus lupulus]
MEESSYFSTLKFMTQDFVRLDRFDETNFVCWQDNIRFLLTTLKVFYVLDKDLKPLEATKEDNTQEVIKERKKREKDELICRGYILNALLDHLYNLYTNTKTAKEIWERSTNWKKKFYDMKPLLLQIQELKIIVNQLSTLNIVLRGQFLEGAIIAKLPPSWRGYRKKILHKNKEIPLEEILKNLSIEEESCSKDKNEKGSNGETSKDNVVGNPPKGQGIGKNKGNGQRTLGPKKNEGKILSNWYQRQRSIIGSKKHDSQLESFDERIESIQADFRRELMEVRFEFQQFPKDLDALKYDG